MHNTGYGGSLSLDGKIAIGSSVTVIVFVMTSIACFIFGFLCHHWFSGKETTRRESALENLPQGPLYDNVLPTVPSQRNSETLSLELKENIAYGPINALCSY